MAEERAWLGAVVVFGWLEEEGTPATRDLPIETESEMLDVPTLAGSEMPAYRDSATLRQLPLVLGSRLRGNRGGLSSQ